MNAPLLIQGRDLSKQDIEQIHELMLTHPEWGRSKLSVALAESWNWRTYSGQLKDIAARTMLCKLEQRGLLVLPRRRTRMSRSVSLQTNLSLDEPPPAQIKEPLVDLLPLHFQNVRAKDPQCEKFKRYLARYHYLGYHGPVGENIGYLVRDRQGRDLACVLFGAAAWKTQARDEWIGWDDTTRAKNLLYIVNNSRFLILPWVRVENLASHILGRLTRRLRADWKAKYAHEVYLVETFVQHDRFRGTCYRAANWRYIGKTKGRSRQDRYANLSVPIKNIYAYGLCNDFQDRLKRS